MHAIEFTTELGEQPVIAIPEHIAVQLPKAGHARIVIVTGDDPEDAEWRAGAYEQFMRDDDPEDSVYDDWGANPAAAVSSSSQSVSPSTALIPWDG